jgi:hypothetical protein
MAQKLRDDITHGHGHSGVDRPIVTLRDRLEFGNLTVAEILAAKPVSKTQFYADLKRGLVRIEKDGRRTLIRGPIARKYLANEPLEGI